MVLRCLVRCRPDRRVFFEAFVAILSLLNLAQFGAYTLVEPMLSG